jgi:hypothetical protein
MTMNNETAMTLTASPLTGDALIAKVAELDATAARYSTVISISDKVRACGYIHESGSPAFTAYYEALIEAKGVLTKDYTPKFEEGSIAEELAESYPAEAVQAFIDYFGEGDLDGFEDSYRGEYESGAEFAKEFVEGCYGESNLPWFVVTDWEATWYNLTDDFIELDGFFFSTQW